MVFDESHPNGILLRNHHAFLRSHGVLSTPESSVVVSQAHSEDIASIYRLAQSHRLRSKTKAETPRSGFLVSGFTLSDYHQFLKRTEYFYCARCDDEVVGFIMGYSSHDILRSEWLNMEIKRRYPGEFILLKQVCVGCEYMGKGIGRMLYHHLFSASDGLHALGSLVTDPPNLRSIAFHRDLGGVEYFEATPPDGLPRCVWFIRNPFVTTQQK